jgi:hypothetical protein
VVAGGELGLAADGAVEEAGGVGDADEDGGAVLAGGGEDAAAEVLLQQVVDDLGRGVALLDGDDGFVYLSHVDGGTEGDADGADEAFGLRALEFGPEGVVLDGVETGVVQLVEVDVVGAEAAEGLLEGLAHVGRRPVVGAFALVG